MSSSYNEALELADSEDMPVGTSPNECKVTRQILSMPLKEELHPAACIVPHNAKCIVSRAARHSKSLCKVFFQDSPAVLDGSE